MKKSILLLAGLVFAFTSVLAQDEDGGLKISGSGDIYYKYDFSGYISEDGTSNIGTSFADNQNSVSVGMLDVVLEQQVGKASFVGEFSFGPRSFKSIPTFNIAGGDNVNINIQNLYMSYAFSDLFSLTAGYMGTFVGYEVISPAANFNYSTSYLFSFGPFQNAGLRADFAVSDRFAFMVGIFNDWNVYQDLNGVTDFGAQLYFLPVDGWDVYLNFLTGDQTGTIIDLTTGFQISDQFYLGLNAADFSIADGADATPYSGFALYPQYAFSDAFELGVRYEYFKVKDFTQDGTSYTGTKVSAFTLTANVNAGPLTFIPEFRMDSNSDEVLFVDKDMATTKSASQFLMALVYAF